MLSTKHVNTLSLNVSSMSGIVSSRDLQRLPSELTDSISFPVPSLHVIFVLGNRLQVSQVSVRSMGSVPISKQVFPAISGAPGQEDQELVQTRKDNIWNNFLL